MTDDPSQQKLGNDGVALINEYDDDDENNSHRRIPVRCVVEMEGSWQSARSYGQFAFCST